MSDTFRRRRGCVVDAPSTISVGPLRGGDAPPQAGRILEGGKAKGPSAHASSLGGAGWVSASP